MSSFVVYISSQMMVYMQWHSRVICGWLQLLHFLPCNGSYELKESQQFTEFSFIWLNNLKFVERKTQTFYLKYSFFSEF